MTAAEVYLAAYDEQIRARITAAEAAGGRADRDGPAVRKAWQGERGLITYRDLDGLDGAALDAFGFRYIQVDASPDSRPVLARLGLLPVATTIPFIWDPAGRGSAGKEPPDA